MKSSIEGLAFRSHLWSIDKQPKKFVQDVTWLIYTFGEGNMAKYFDWLKFMSCACDSCHPVVCWDLVT